MMSFLKRIWIDYRLQLARKNSVSFLVLLMLLSLGYFPLPEDGYVTFSVSRVVGSYNSVWMAIIFSMMTSMLVMLFGFYFIKGSISLDRKQNMGSLLAHSSTSNWEYLLQKTIASFLVLASICFVTLLTTMCLNILIYNQFPFELGIYIWLYALVLLPSLFLCAAFTTLFDSHPRLSGAVGNVVYFFLYTGILASLGGGLMGFTEIVKQIDAAIIHAFPNVATSGVSIGVLVDSPENLKAHPTITLNELVLNNAVLLESALVLLFALLVFALAVFSFDRFKHAPETAKKQSDQSAYSSRLFNYLRTLFPNSAFARLLITEMSLLTRATPKLLWIVMAVLNVTIIAMLYNDIAKVLIGLLCVLNLSVLGKLGIREEKAQLSLLLNHFNVTEMYRRNVQLAAGSIVVLVTQIGSIVWVFAQYGVLNTISFVMGIVLWVLLSFVLGPWFRQRHPFDLIFLFIWYIGPMNGLAELDFLAVHRETSLYSLALLFSMSLVLYALVCTKVRRYG